MGESIEGLSPQHVLRNILIVAVVVLQKHQCPPGEFCKPQLMQCFRAPCIPPSIATCVPESKVINEQMSLRNVR